MRYQDDINTKHNRKSIGRALSGSVDKAPESELYRHGFESSGEQQFLLTII